MFKGYESQEGEGHHQYLQGEQTSRAVAFVDPVVCTGIGVAIDEQTAGLVGLVG